MIINASPWDHETRHEPIADPNGGPPAWLDRLVELHVLAEHGDHAAAQAGARWIADDTEARRVWEGVEQLRAELGPTAAASIAG